MTLVTRNILKPSQAKPSQAKPSRNTLITILFLFVFSSTAFANTREGLVGWWRFEEGTGTSASDSSRNANTGTLTNFNFDGTDGWRTACARANCLLFDGTDDSIDVGNISSLNGAQAFTISFWTYFSAFKVNDILFIKRVDNNNRIAAVLSSVAGAMNFFVSDGANTFAQLSAGTLKLGQWQNLVFHFDGTQALGSRLRLFVNGVQVTLGAELAPAATDSNAVHLTFGSAFSGYMDDVRVYNRALTAQEIKDLYNPSIIRGNGILRRGKLNY